MKNMHINGGFTVFELVTFLTSIGIFGLVYLVLINI